ncbi:transcription termination/antitermination protein NusG, partial [Candidatus Sumerlaeota bacterium]|nr:transcription termination/antitermination protein NusG [Candidatus Sumerlaeota bacterium]
MAAAEQTAQTTGSAPAQGTQKRWYAIQTYSSFENKVKQGIEHKATLEGLREQIHRVLIPTETVIEIKGGKKRSVNRAL